MKFIYNFIARIYYSLIVFRNYLYSKYFTVKISDFYAIPIVVNNRNRYTFLKQLIDYLIINNFSNIYILDNDSTYPPLIEYYLEVESKGISVIRLQKNLGFKALEMVSLFKKIRQNYYIYTDPDVIPTEDCPVDFINHFYNLLQKYPKVQKVGFSLKINDLPDHFDKKHEVIKWEKNLYVKNLEEGVYEAPIDTTFALHRPLSSISTQGRFKNIRTTFPYEARHMPWYNDSCNLSEEEMYYINHVEIGTHWSKRNKVENISFLRRLFDKFIFFQF